MSVTVYVTNSPCHFYNLVVGVLNRHAENYALLVGMLLQNIIFMLILEVQIYCRNLKYK